MQPHSHHDHQHGNGSLLQLASHATLHCLAWPVNYWLLKRSIKQKCH